MELFDAGTLVFLIVFGFLSAFIDAVVGGGGLISVPALLWTGLPPVTVLGTNKVAAVMGAFTSFLAFVKSGKVDGWLIRRLFPISLLGSSAGVLAVRMVPSEFLRPLVTALLIFVLIYSILKKDWGKDTVFHSMSTWMLFLSALVAFLFGFYDGFFGPGTGSFLLFAFLLVGFDFLGAAANARALNFGSNIAAAILFSYFGEVNFSYAIPMGLSMILGAYCGARVALWKGVSFVRPLFIVVTTVLIGKQLFELFK